MAKSDRTPKQQPAEQQKPQPLNAFLVEEREGRDAYWHRVGTAWKHSDGKGFDIVLPPGMSLSGRIVIRERKPKDAAGSDDDTPF